MHLSTEFNYAKGVLTKNIVLTTDTVNKPTTYKRTTFLSVTRNDKLKKLVVRSYSKYSKSRVHLGAVFN